MPKLSEIVKSSGMNMTACSLHETPNEYFCVNYGVKGTNPQANVLYVCTEDSALDFLHFSSCGTVVCCSKGIMPDTDKIRSEFCIVDCDDALSLMCMMQDYIIHSQRKTRIADLGRRMIVQRTNLGVLVRDMCGIIGNPIAVYDSSYNLLAMESMGMPVDNRVWNIARTEGSFPPLVIEEFRTAIGERDISHTPFLCTTHAWENMHCLVMQLLSKTGTLLGSVAVYEAFRPFLPEDAGIVIQAAEVLAEHMASSAYSTDAKTAAETFLKELVSGDIGDKAAAEYKASSKELSNYNFFCAGYVQVTNEQAKQRQREYFRGEISKLSEHIITITKNKNLVVLICGSDREQLDSLSGRIAEVLEKHGLSMGLSCCFTELSQVRKMYYQARETQITASAILGDANVYQAQDVLFYTLIRNLSPDHIRTLYESTFYFKIKEYDCKQMTNYCNTLTIHIENMFISSRTAEKLYIHKNSLLYRLGRCNSLFGFNLGSFHDSFNFWLGYKLHLYLNYLDKNRNT